MNQDEQDQIFLRVSRQLREKQRQVAALEAQIRHWGKLSKQFGLAVESFESGSEVEVGRLSQGLPDPEHLVAYFRELAEARKEISILEREARDLGV